MIFFFNNSKEMSWDVISFLVQRPVITVDTENDVWNVKKRCLFYRNRSWQEISLQCLQKLNVLKPGNRKLELDWTIPCERFMHLYIPPLKTGIRHPEELSLCKPLDPDDLKQNFQDTALKRRPPQPTKEAQTGERIDTNTFVSGSGTMGRQYHSNGSLNGTMNRAGTPSRNGTLNYHSNPVIKLIQCKMQRNNLIIALIFLSCYFFTSGYSPQWKLFPVHQWHQQQRPLHTSQVSPTIQPGRSAQF